MKWLPSLRRESLEDLGPPGAAAGGAFDGAGPAAGPAPPSGDAVVPDGKLESPTETTTAVLSPADLEAVAAQLKDDPSLPAASVSSLLAEMRMEIAGKHQALHESQRALHDLFTTRLRSDEAQSRAVEKLHDELRDYKANFVRQQMLPMLKEVVFCHDFLTDEIERLTGGESASDPAAIRALEAARQMLVDLMFKYDVEPYRAEGEMFDPKWQQCARTVPTGRSDADKTIAARGREGFRSPEAIIRREQVSVYKFTPGAD